MVIILLKIVLTAYFVTAAYCEWSTRFRDCSWFIVIRLGLMLLPAILFAKVGVLALAPVWLQLSVLALFILGGTILYKNILSKQLRISGFTSKRLGIHKYKVRELNGREING